MPGFVAFDKGMRHVDIFRYDDACRHVPAVIEFVSSSAQRRAQHGLDALQRPAALQGCIDQRIEPALFPHDAADDVAEESRFGRQILLPLHLTPDPVAFELRQDFVQRGARHIHLIECLYCRKPRGASAIGFTFVLGGSGGHRVNRPRRGA